MDMLCAGVFQWRLAVDGTGAEETRSGDKMNMYLSVREREG